MTSFIYENMKLNICYSAICPIGGYCVIKKTADLIPNGNVWVLYKDQHSMKERHFSFFELR